MVEVRHHSGVASSAASGAVLEDDVREALLQPAVHTVNAHDVAVCAALGSSAFVADMEQIAAVGVVVDSEQVELIVGDDVDDLLFHPVYCLGI